MDGFDGQFRVEPCANQSKMVDGLFKQARSESRYLAILIRGLDGARRGRQRCESRWERDAPERFECVDRPEFAFSQLRAEEREVAVIQSGCCRHDRDACRGRGGHTPPGRIRAESQGFFDKYVQAETSGVL